MKIRPARLDDVNALLAIEEESFDTDKLTRRKLRHLITRGHCALLVGAQCGEVAGYALLLFRRGVPTARIYGLAVASSHRGRGLGRRLLVAAETEARRHRCRRLTLEVATSNRQAVRLYRKQGYSLLARLGPYYEDGARASRYVKSLSAARP